MTLCACGCARPTPSPRATYATDRCRWRTDKRRARQSEAGVDELDLIVCAVCQKEVARGARSRRRRYHDGCRPIARKLLRDARENAAT